MDITNAIDQLKLRWNAELPTFWAKAQRILLVLGGVSALMPDDVKAYLPHNIIAFFCVMSFTSAFVAQFTKRDYATK